MSLDGYFRHVKSHVDSYTLERLQSHVIRFEKGKQSNPCDTVYSVVYGNNLHWDFGYVGHKHVILQTKKYTYLYFLTKYDL